MRMLRLCDALLFYTDKEVEEYEKNRSVGRSEIVRALNNGINTEPIELVRAPFDPAQRGMTILFIGRLTAKAQLSLVLDALARIPAPQRPRLEVIGAGEEQGQLERQSHLLRLEDSVFWHGAIIDEARIASIANRCRLFVYPGEVGLSLIHAMAYGLPAIVHSDRWRQMPEFAAFEDNVTGRSFDRGDASSLAGILTEMLTDEFAMSSYSALALSRVKETFNTRDMAIRFVEIIDMLGGSGTSASRAQMDQADGPL